jgi:hypothetical protein
MGLKGLNILLYSSCVRWRLRALSGQPQDWLFHTDAAHVQAIV